MFNSFFEKNKLTSTKLIIQDLNRNSEGHMFNETYQWDLFHPGKCFLKSDPGKIIEFQEIVVSSDKFQRHCR